MTIMFSEEELKWIKKNKFHWEAKEGCPKKIRRTLSVKIAELYNEEHYGETKRSRGKKHNDRKS